MVIFLLLECPSGEFNGSSPPTPIGDLPMYSQVDGSDFVDSDEERPLRICSAKKNLSKQKKRGNTKSRKSFKRIEKSLNSSSSSSSSSLIIDENPNVGSSLKTRLRRNPSPVKR